MTRIVRTNYSCEHSHSRECETALRASALWVAVQYRLAGTEKRDLERCWQLSALLIGDEIHTEASSLAAAADRAKCTIIFKCV